MTEIAQRAEATAAIESRIVDQLKVDERLRQVEINQAEMGAVVSGLEKSLSAMEQRLIREIQDSRPKNVAAWVMAGIAIAAIILTPIITAVMQK